MGARDWIGIKSNVKKTVFLASFFVCVLLIFSLFAEQIVGLFDKKGDFTGLAAATFSAFKCVGLFRLVANNTFECFAWCR